MLVTVDEAPHFAGLNVPNVHPRGVGVGLAAADFTDDNPWFPRGLNIILWNVNSRATLPKQSSGTERLQRFVIGFLCELPLQSRIYRIRERWFARAVQFPVPQSGSAIWRGNVDRARLDRSVR